MLKRRVYKHAYKGREVDNALKIHVAFVVISVSYRFEY